MWAKGYRLIFFTIKGTMCRHGEEDRVGVVDLDELQWSVVSTIIRIHEMSSFPFI
jgi:hypothetical protein